MIQALREAKNFGKILVTTMILVGFPVLKSDFIVWGVFCFVLLKDISEEWNDIFFDTLS